MDDGGGSSACSRPTWLDSRTALLNSSSSAASHSSSNVDESGEQYPRRRARSITMLMRWRCLGKTAPCADGVRQTSDDGGAINVLHSRVAQSVAAQHSTSRVAEHAERQKSSPRPASLRCGRARLPAVVPVHQHVIASSCCL